MRRLYLLTYWFSGIIMVGAFYFLVVPAHAYVMLITEDSYSCSAIARTIYYDNYPSLINRSEISSEKRDFYASASVSRAFADVSIKKTSGAIFALNINSKGNAESYDTDYLSDAFSDANALVKFIIVKESADIMNTILVPLTIDFLFGGDSAPINKLTVKNNNKNIDLFHGMYNYMGFFGEIQYEVGVLNTLELSLFNSTPGSYHGQNYYSNSEITLRIPSLSAVIPQISLVPVPASITLLAAGLSQLILYGFRKQKATH